MKAEGKRIQSEELWIYLHMLTEDCTEQSVLTELNTIGQLLGFVVCRKRSFFGHTTRDSDNELVKGNGKLCSGRPKTSYTVREPKSGWAEVLM